MVLETEINAVTDNPLVMENGEVISGGNFHGQPVAIAMDLAGIALAELANISERRIEQLVNPHLSSGLPPFLTPQAGLNSGFMIAQVVAASLVSENKVLAHPASVDSIPSSANREDHVSMGTFAARKAKEILYNVQRVLAIEMLCAAQGLTLRSPLKTSKPLQAVLELIRQRIPPLTDDRSFHRDIETMVEMMESHAMIGAAESVNISID
jgi:histidine ammonia-lyase